MVFWYTNQECCIRWGLSLSRSLKVSNGVCQGGILSPILFNMYMNDLSILLNNSNVQCKMKGILYNNLMCVDDRCVVAPSPSALRKLLDVCSKFADRIMSNLMGRSPNICISNLNFKKIFMFLVYHLEVKLYHLWRILSILGCYVHSSLIKRTIKLKYESLETRLTL